MKKQIKQEFMMNSYEKLKLQNNTLIIFMNSFLNFGNQKINSASRLYFITSLIIGTLIQIIKLLWNRQFNLFCKCYMKEEL